MNNENNQDTTGQGGIDSETERRNRENETGEQSQQAPEAGQSQQAPQAGQQQPPEAGQQSGQSDSMTKPADNFATDKQASEQGSEGGSGFVGSSSDQSSDYLTKGEKQDFAPEGQGASDTNAGTSDIETGQSSNIDATLDDGADTSQ